MRAVVQRVAWAKVTVDGEVVGRCGPGFLALIGAGRGDQTKDAEWLADRVAGLRIMPDPEGKMNLALRDVPAQGPQVLAISNFTLYGDVVQRRPSFIKAAPYEEGERLFVACVAHLRKLGLEVETGVFGAHMDVEMVADGPVTIVFDSPA